MDFINNICIQILYYTFIKCYQNFVIILFKKKIKKILLFYLQIIFVFESAYEPNNEKMASHLSQHGDGVRDIVFNVQDIDIIVKVR